MRCCTQCWNTQNFRSPSHFVCVQPLFQVLLFSHYFGNLSCADLFDFSTQKLWKFLKLINSKVSDILHLNLELSETNHVLNFFLRTPNVRRLTSKLNSLNFVLHLIKQSHVYWRACRVTTDRGDHKGHR